MAESIHPDELARKMGELGAYSRLPERLLELYPFLSKDMDDDTFGLEDRLLAIQQVLSGRHLGAMVDLGGNMGYFSLSLIDSNMATNSVVYDIDKSSLSAGKLAAHGLGIEDMVSFVEQEVSLDFVREMKTVDTVICLNLIHHAGVVFDVDDVLQDGWERYAELWLEHLRRKCGVAIIGVGFKGQKPCNWDIAPPERPKRFSDIAVRAGWTIRYDANVHDLQLLGVQRANGRRTKKGVLSKIARRLTHVSQNYLSSPTGSKKEKYHLYILE